MHYSGAYQVVEVLHIPSLTYHTPGADRTTRIGAYPVLDFATGTPTVYGVCNIFTTFGACVA